MDPSRPSCRVMHTSTSTAGRQCALCVPQVKPPPITHQVLERIQNCALRHELSCAHTHLRQSPTPHLAPDARVRAVSSVPATPLGRPAVRAPRVASLQHSQPPQPTQTGARTAAPRLCTNPACMQQARSHIHMRRQQPERQCAHNHHNTTAASVTSLAAAHAAHKRRPRAHSARYICTLLTVHIQGSPLR